MVEVTNHMPQLIVIELNEFCIPILEIIKKKWGTTESKRKKPGTSDRPICCQFFTPFVRS